MVEEKKEEMVCPICAGLGMLKRTQFGKHLRASQREFLVAIRSLIDAKIDQLKDSEESPGRKVEVK